MPPDPQPEPLSAYVRRVGANGEAGREQVADMIAELEAVADAAREIVRLRSIPMAKWTPRDVSDWIKAIAALKAVVNAS